MENISATMNASLSSINASKPSNFVVSESDDATKTTILVIFSCIIIMINAFIAILFLVDKNLKQRPANIMICSQACADLYTGIVFIPLYLVKSELSVLLQPFLNGYMLYVGLLNLMALSIDRYLAILKPFLHHRLINKQCTKRIIFVVWVVPIALTMIPLFWWFEDEDVKRKIHKVYVCIQWSIMLFTVISMTVLYLFITKKARKSIRVRIDSCGEKTELKVGHITKKELRVVHLFGWLLFFLVAAYSPILYMNFCYFILEHPSLVPNKLITVSVYLLVVNSIANPILCIFLKKDYLEAITKIKYVVSKWRR